MDAFVIAGWHLSRMDLTGKYRVLDGGLATELILQHNLTITVMHQ